MSLNLIDAACPVSQFPLVMLMKRTNARRLEPNSVKASAGGVSRCLWRFSSVTGPERSSQPP